MYDWLVYVLTLTLGLMLGVGMGGCRSENELPDPSSETYAEMVSAFYTGLAALQVGEHQLAEELLTQATELVPQEPAAWAGLGVLALRQNELEQAASRLERARVLFPESSKIHYLLGVLERERGRMEQAATHLRRASELDPHNLEALYTLAEVIEQRGGEGSTAEVQQLMGRILDVQPRNLVVLLERARLAAGQNDTTLLRRAVEQVAEQAEDWPPAVQDQLQELQEVVATQNMQEAAMQIAFLKNVLKQVPAYREDLASVQVPAGQAGELVTQFLRLPPPPATPAPPDSALTFAADTLSASASWTWAKALPLMLEQSPMTAEPLPSLVVANGSQVRVDTSVLPFPGGASATPPSPHGIMALDYNYDFRRDLAFAGAGGMRLFRHEEDGSFVEVTGQLGLPASVTEAAYEGVWAADLDMEGDLDLVLATPEEAPLVLRNNGDGTFASWPLFQDVRGLRGFAWGDLDADGDLDVVLLDAAGALHLFANQRAGQFRSWQLPSQVDDVLSVEVADVDSDGRMDLLALQASGAVQRLSYQPAHEGWSVEQVAQWSELAEGDEASAAAQLFAADLDNNGGLDLIGATSSQARVWLSTTEGHFMPLDANLEPRIFSVADLEGDGSLDLIGVTEAGHAVQLASQSTKSYHAKSIHLRAARTRGDQRINAFGIGGEVEIRSGMLFQKQPITSPVVHFGLGEHAEVDVVRIVWPNGTVQAEFDLASDQTVLARQRLKGSCPWVFTHNGEGMQFVTDFLWRTALGLRINAQGNTQVIHSIDWVKIGGDQLAPHDGFYDVRITAELWETHFFDHVSLMVVDHPAGTEVFVDERFVLPAPDPAVHVTAPLRPVAKAWDSSGRDVTALVQARDERYLDTFELGAYQGLTDEVHHVEVELGEDVPSEGPLWLVASGWVYPTDSSINMAIGQGTHEPPRGLRLEVPDGEGGWAVVDSNLGFPAGKTKTILVDLEGVFRPDTPRRVRLSTNMEVYWDRLAWAPGRPDVELRTEKLLPQTAQLRYRGFSAVRQASRKAPELPVYDALMATTPQWRDLIGYYTRFGDVRELVEHIDDRYVIMNAGDELVFRFPELPPPPDGWERDFVLIGDGWVKDGDYNTGFSKTVLPLPYHGMEGYSHPPGRLQDDPAYQQHPEDWRTYHTRYVTPQRFNSVLVTEPSR